MKPSLLFLLLLLAGCNHSKPTESIASALAVTTNQPANSAAQGSDYLLRFYDDPTDKYGYKNANGEVVIAVGNYGMCFTDTFKTYALVGKSDAGIVGIDRQENIMYNVFIFDNGPDEASDGLFRIIMNSKMGYADAATGKIVIQPQFDCAWPFEDGIATVSYKCTTKIEGEHSTWESDNWIYINTKGKKVEKPK